MKKENFGFLPTGESVEAYTLSNDKASVRVMTRGATVLDFTVSGIDVVAGYDTLEDYVNETDSHMGGLIGRVSNRIAGAEFSMDGKTFRVPANDHAACLHGGNGFDHRLFEVTELKEDSITMRYVSADGEEGFPSLLTVYVTYRLCDTSLVIKYRAVPDGKTPIALTNHSYFNLNGVGDTILHHKMKIYADEITAVDGELIPTGEHPTVKGTPFDFLDFHEIGEYLNAEMSGYDHNFVLNRKECETVCGMRLAKNAEIYADSLKMTVYSDQPGLQFYTGDCLCGAPDFRGGIKRVINGAFCVETQAEPDSIHRGVGFYDKGEEYTHTCIYKIDIL